MIFITLMCKIPTSPVKKNVMINVNMIKYMAPNGIDGSGTLIFLGGGDYLVADKSFQEVAMRIDDALRDSDV